jgi:hypothetical protein
VPTSRRRGSTNPARSPTPLHKYGSLYIAGYVKSVRQVRAAAARTRGVAAGRSAQRGTSGAATGGGGPQAGPQAPPTRTRTSLRPRRLFRDCLLVERVSVLHRVRIPCFTPCGPSKR